VGIGVTDGTCELIPMRLDFNAANAVVEATHRYKEIFYDE
jgi:hypothetical protein